MRGGPVSKSLVITEKPSVARDIVAALDSLAEHEGYWENDRYVVTYTVGHLVELLEPEDLDPAYKRWVLDQLPILPREFRLKPKSRLSERVRVIRKLLKRADVTEVINACDAGREGELIFREIMEFLGSRKPVKRLWLQSMTSAAIRGGFAHLAPGEQYDGLASAAACRSHSDWLIGMNATRALTKRLRGRREKAAWSAGSRRRPWRSWSTASWRYSHTFPVLTGGSRCSFRPMGTATPPSGSTRASARPRPLRMLATIGSSTRSAPERSRMRFAVVRGWRARRESRVAKPPRRCST
jgi:hypothetical protein